MAVRVRGGRFMLDVRHMLDGRVQRFRLAVPDNKQTRRGAEAFEREVLADLRAGIDPRRRTEETAPTTTTTEAPTLRDYVPTFLREHAIARGLKPSTQISNEHIARTWLIPVLGDRRLDEIRTGDLMRLRETMAKAKRSAKTQNNVVVVASSLVKHWYAMNDRPAPTFRLGLATTDETAIDAYTVAQAAALVEGASKAGSAELAFVLLGLDAGMRLSEARALHWADLDLRSERPTVTISRSREGRRPKRTRVAKLVEIDAFTTEVEHSAKSRRVRVVPLTQRLAAALRALPRAVHDPHVFLDRSGLPLTRSGGRQLVRRAQARGGLPVDGRFHVERHTFVTALLEAGAPQHVAQALAGHSDPRVTARYSHVREGEGDAAIAAMERRLGVVEGGRRGHILGTRRRARS